MATLADRLHAVIVKAGIGATPSAPPSPGTVLLHDDFAGYADTMALRNAIVVGAGGLGGGPILYTDGWHCDQVSLDPTVPYNGHATLKMTLPGGVQNCPMLWAQLPKNLDILWFRARMRFSPGFTDTGTLTNSANAIKLLAFGHTTYDGSARLEVTNTTQYTLYWNVQAKNTGTLIGGGQTVSPGRITTEWTPGAQWWDYIIKADRTTGLVSVWGGIDGQPKTLIATTPPETMQDGSAMPQIDKVGFTIEFNQVRAASNTEYLWLGAWEVIDGSVFPNPYTL